MNDQSREVNEDVIERRKRKRPRRMMAGDRKVKALLLLTKVRKSSLLARAQMTMAAEGQFSIDFPMREVVRRSRMVAVGRGRRTMRRCWKRSVVVDKNTQLGQTQQPMMTLVGGDRKVDSWGEDLLTRKAAHR